MISMATPNPAALPMETVHGRIDFKQNPPSEPPTTAYRIDNLWEQALETLAVRDKSQIICMCTDEPFKFPELVDAVQEMRRKCMQKRLKYTKRNGEVVILRDVFEKVMKWVIKFREVGDMAAQYDPAHAALPWAGVRLLLQVAINDTESFGAMAEGVEFVSRSITRYGLIERLYLEKDSMAKVDLRRAVLDQYAAILQYLSKAVRFYSRKTTERLLLSAIQTAESSVEVYVRAIKEAQTYVDNYVQLVEAEYREESQAIIMSVDSKVDCLRRESRRHFLSILHELQAPIIRISTQLSDLQDYLNTSERIEILNWVSQVPYMKHHKEKVKERMPCSGHWLSKNHNYLNWRDSSASSILWLHGIPGSGKSILVSSVIDNLRIESSINDQAAPISFFYCARNAAEPERSDAEEILRSILEQLSSSSPDLPIRQPIVKVYKQKKRDAKGRPPEKLTREETLELILTILEDSPAIIIIDALDECEPGSRHVLLEALDMIIQLSASLVQIFVSSRDDGDIVCRLTNSPNVFIRACDSQNDIERFVHTKVAEAIQMKRLLKGKVSEELENRITDALVDGAKGMFRWVSLQIQNLCNPRRMKFDQDVIAELGRLPATLKESYDIIYQMISESGPISRIMAKKIFTWLLCAQRPLRSRELVAAVTVDSNGLLLSSTNDDILDVCCNIVILDMELDIFRFAHLSVREYLEGRADYAISEMHTIVLDRCLDVCVDQRRRDSLQHFTVEQHEILRPYSAMYWPLHLHLLDDYDLAENLKEKVIRFLFDRSGTSATFQDWLGTAQELAANLPYLHPLKAMLKASLSDPPTPLFVACSFGLMSVLKSLSTYDNIDWNKGNISKHRGLHLAVLYKHVNVVRFLLEQNVDTQVIQDGAGLTPLFLAAKSGAKEIVRLLLEHESELQPTYSSGYLPLHVAALEGRYEAVESLLKHGANVNARYPEHALVFGLPEPQTVALHNAAERGHEAVVRLLLEHDADIEAKNPFGTTALHDTAASGHTEALKTLLEYGARTDVRDVFGNTPLHGATLNGNEKAVRLLLENNADIETRNDLGARALDIAVRSTNARLVQTLLEYGAKVDAKDRKGNTALHRASLSGQEDAIRLLLENNADPLERNNDGQSPEDLLAKPEMREWYSNIYKREALEG